jgi:membrane-associated phospholipid phosphatase
MLATSPREESESIMAQRRGISHNMVAPDGIQDRGYTLGRLLSQIFHPILLNIVTFLIVGYYTLATHTAGLKWAGICILVQVLPPTAFFGARLRQGAYSDEDISIRQQRNEMYGFGFVWVLIATTLLFRFGAPLPLLAVMIAALILGLLGGMINLFWKISVHAAAIASTATIALLYSRTLGIALWLCALAVGWARVRTGNHTLMQVLAGFGCAASVVLIVFHVIGIRG